MLDHLERVSVSLDGSPVLVHFSYFLEASSKWRGVGVSYHQIT